MRGSRDPRGSIFSCVAPEQRVPKAHPLRRIKIDADAVLKGLSATFDGMYSTKGRPSIPPERLLKSLLLIALFSVRSDRQFCEMLDYNILFRWFLDMNLDEASFDASTFSKNRERLLKYDVAHQFFAAVVERARQQGVLSDEHFTVDSTLIEAWASLKSFQPKDRADREPPDDPGNTSVDFRGQRRSNETHQSTTDPESRLLRKGPGKEAKLCFAGHALMDNRHGLCTDLLVTASVGVTEPQAAAQMLDRQQINAGTLGADKGYYTRDFVAGLRQRGIKPHIAMKDHRISGLDRRTTRHAGYAISQRQRIEEIFGWAKTIGGLRKTRFRGVARTQQFAHLVAAAYNLLRLARLQCV